jgi:CubicO group peptidase (beta-lactamase class C family)
LDDLQNFVTDFCQARRIPAISVAISARGSNYAAAAGTLNTSTGVKATEDAIFQIGSITKSMTASVIMRLVERGLITLDQAVSEIIEDFRLRDKTLSDQVTVRQLLCHTNGIPGDLFDDDSNAFGHHIKLLVDRCSDLDFIHHPGEQFSYSNTAYAIAGRVTEVVLGMPWEQAISEEVYAPLEMHSATAYPRDSIRHRVAMGHFPDPDSSGDWTVAPSNFLSLGMAPAGTTLMMSASDLLKFAAAHTPGREKTDWLSREGVTAMQISQFDLPKNTPFNATGWGLGWLLTDASGQMVFGHDGGTLGQVSTLRIIPGTGAAIAILLNASQSSVLQEFYSLVADHLGDTVVNRIEPSQSTAPLDLERFIGRYEAVGSRSEVVLSDDELEVQVESDLPVPNQELRLKFIEDQCFASYGKDGTRGSNYHFLDPDEDGKPGCLFAGLRLSKRLG